MTGGQQLLALAYEDWARENTVRAFVFGWVAVVSVWLFLDWIGNPNRGRFRAQGPMRARGLRGRIGAWRVEKDHYDAEVRETLRSAYGKSSLRLGWSSLDETAATAYDETHLSPVPRLLEIGAESNALAPTLQTEWFEHSWDGSDGVEIDLTDAPVAPAPIEAEIDLTDVPSDTEAIPRTSRVMVTERTSTAETKVAPTETVVETEEGWSVGKHPTSPTPTGDTPTRTTVRSRAWKNASRSHLAVGRDNARRMAKGRPPRRWNPITGKSETAKIDVDNSTFDVTWTTTGIDPFSAEQDRPDTQSVS